ncbi:MAG: exonuclease SbcCD subunit D [Firmicutes bacterium]|nr:exonuclease SbcCD subunit D [Bacillota bacterium]
MRFLHVADLHLGKVVNEFPMIRDQEYILEKICRIVQEKKIDAVLISGDIYDRSIPPEEAVRVLDRFLSRLSADGVFVLMISGNHDSDERLNYGSSLFISQKVYITSVYEGELREAVLEDGFGRVHFWMLPFVKASRVGHYHPEVDTSSYDAAVRAAISCGVIDPKERNVLLSHQFVTGGSKDPETAGSENTPSEAVGTIEKVDASAFDLFDYVALGHIHRPQKIGRNEVRYAGSILKYSLSEIDHEKSAVLVTMEEKGNVQTELIPLLPRREMRHIKGPFSELMKPEFATDDYMYVTLTDEDIIPDAIQKIRTYYPHTMKLDYQNSHTRAAMEFSFASEDLSVRPEELLRDFYRKIAGGEPSEEEWAILLRSAGKAGVIDETD